MSHAISHRAERKEASQKLCFEEINVKNTPPQRKAAVRNQFSRLQDMTGMCPLLNYCLIQLFILTVPF